jgi:hypothetical protein
MFGSEFFHEYVVIAQPASAAQITMSFHVLIFFKAVSEGHEEPKF